MGNGNPFEDESLTNHPSVEAPPANGNPFADASLTAEATPSGSASPEEQAFLQANPDHKFLPADPAFPNRPAGVYPTGPGNEWRSDPTQSQSPVDLHFAKHTAEGAGQAALATLPAMGAGFVSPVFSAVASHLDKVKTIIDYAEKIGLKGLE